MRQATSWVKYALLALGLVSGGVALSYEVLWTRELLNLTGSTTRATALVLASFMAGLACGAWLVGVRTVRSSGALWMFVAAETMLSLIGTAFPNIIDVLSRQVSGTTSLTILLVGILFVPALLMGVALPALAAALQRLGEIRLKYVAALYGFNTFGGAVAALAIMLGLLPAIGLINAQRTVALIGLLSALVGAGLAIRLSNYAPTLTPKRNAASWRNDSRFFLTPLAMAILLSGTAALGYQVLWTRVLVLIIGSSSNAFAIMLGLYLFGLALGGVAIGKIIQNGKNFKKIFQWLQLGVASSAIAGTGLIWFLPSLALFGFSLLGASAAAVALVMGGISTLIILPPTIFIGATFPTAVRLLQGQAPQRGREVGLALALTTFGNVAGILLAAFLVIPAIGLQRGIQVLAVANIAAAIIVLLSTPVNKNAKYDQRFVVLGSAVLILACAMAVPTWNNSLMTSGVFRQAPVYLKLLGGADRLHRAFSAYQTLYYREGREAVVAVYERPTLQGTGHRILTIDGKVDASTGADMTTQVLSGHLPFLFRPEAKNALVIGLASGVTVGKLAAHPYEMIDVVEIEPAVVEASATFNKESGAPLQDPRVRLTIADGRRFLSQANTQYDVIVSEPSNPWLSMSARLFTREFFELTRARLAPDGILVQWIPLYGLSTPQFESLLQTLMEVFPNVEMFRVADGDLVAISSVERVQLNAKALEALYSDEHFSDLRRLGLSEPSDLLALWIADAHGLRATLAPSIANTDDNGYLEFGSPWYLLRDTAHDNIALLEKALLASNNTARIVETWSCHSYDSDLLVDLAGIQLSLQRFNIVAEIAESFRSCGDLASADLLLGDIAQAKGRLTEANDIWEQHVGSAFFLRRARLEFKLGNHVKAADLFSEVSEAPISDKDAIIYALSLTSLNRTVEALAVLDARRFEENSAPGIISTFLKMIFWADLEETEKSVNQRKVFEQQLNSLRRCLEREGCRSDVNDLIGWSENASSMLPPSVGEGFQRDIFVRVTRPLGLYMRGVSSMWLGESEAAQNDFRVYLRLLPEADPHSKAHELLSAIEQAADTGDD